MSRGGVTVRRLERLSDEHVHALSLILEDCVAGGASIGFMSPLGKERSLSFWRSVADAVNSGRRALLVAEDSEGIVGTVQLVLDLPDNQPHRGDVCKMLVHRRARRRGIGATLMRVVEDVARECGRTLLVLDAVTDGDAARLYARLGWVRVGDIPNYALFPDGRMCSTTYFYRDLS